MIIDFSVTVQNWFELSPRVWVNQNKAAVLFLFRGTTFTFFTLAVGVTVSDKRDEAAQNDITRYTF